MKKLMEDSLKTTVSKCPACDGTGQSVALAETSTAVPAEVRTLYRCKVCQGSGCVMPAPPATKLQKVGSRL
jgi:DnaJ-class molecular chaperone